MSRTNINTVDGNSKQCPGARRGGPSQRDSWGRCHSDYNGNFGNRSFANYSFVEKIEDSCISNLTITKSGP